MKLVKVHFVIHNQLSCHCHLEGSQLQVKPVTLFVTHLWGCCLLSL